MLCEMSVNSGKHMVYINFWTFSLSSSSALSELVLRDRDSL